MIKKSPGVARKRNPNIPKHINQEKLPNGVYYDARGRGRWYIQYRNEAGALKTQRVGDSKTTLSELHRVIELRNGIDRHTLRYLASQFAASAQFQGLAAKTQKGYEYCRDIVVEFPTKTGIKLGDMSTERFSRPLIQRLVDKFADDGHPRKANAVASYLHRIFRWGMNRGYCNNNPAAGIEHAKERKRRRSAAHTMDRVISRAREKGDDYPKRGKPGSCPTYLWIVLELAYLCRLRGIEVVTLTDANALPEGVLTNRTKGSRDNIVQWTPRLREAWAAAVARRGVIWEKKGKATPFRPDRRPLIVSRSGGALSKSALDTAFQRYMSSMMKDGFIMPEERWGVHDMKRQAITDTPGNRADKQEASGHRSPAMMDIYDLSMPLVNTPEGTDKGPVIYVNNLRKRP